MEQYKVMKQMREHIMKEADTNKDSLITLKEFMEFMESTKNDEFKKDPQWEVSKLPPPPSFS